MESVWLSVHCAYPHTTTTTTTTTTTHWTLTCH